MQLCKPKPCCPVVFREKRTLDYCLLDKSQVLDKNLILGKRKKLLGVKGGGFLLRVMSDDSGDAAQNKLLSVFDAVCEWIHNEASVYV